MDTNIDSVGSGGLKHFWKVVFLLVCFTMLLKIPTFNLPHNEGDEVAFWHLANNWLKTGAYTDKGPDLTPYPAYIDRFTRDMPVHPPLYTALLLPFAKYQVQKYAVLASWVGHIMAIFAVALIGRQVYRTSKDVQSALSPLFWVPLLGIATDPVMTWISGILWIDNLDAGFAAMTIAFALMASTSKRPPVMWSLAGVILGLGLITKVTVGMIIPVLAYIVYLLPDNRERISATLYMVVPALLISMPWYATLYFTMGELIFPKAHLAPGVFQHPPCPFCEISASRPPYYFFLKVILSTPLIIVGLCGLLFALIRKEYLNTGLRLPNLSIPLVWFVVIIVAATIVGSFVMRRISILFPAIYVMIYFLNSWLEDKGMREAQKVVLILSALTISYAGIGGGYYLFHGNHAEFFSPLELAGVINLWSAK